MKNEYHFFKVGEKSDIRVKICILFSKKEIFLTCSKPTPPEKEPLII